MGKTVRAIQCVGCLRVLGICIPDNKGVKKYFEHIHCLKCAKEELNKDGNYTK